MWDFSIYQWLAATVCITATIYWFGIRKFNYFKNLNFPYDKDLAPFIGSMGPFVFVKRSLADLVKDIYDRHDGFNLVGLFEFGKPVLMIRDPELIKLVTVKDFDHFIEKSNHRVVPLKEDIEPLLAKNLLGLPAHKWKEMRSTLSPLFTTSKIKTMFQFVKEIGEQMSQHLEVKCNDEGGSVLLEMKDLFSRYTNDVTATSVFGVKVDSLEDRTNDFFEMGKDVTNFGGIHAFVFFGFRFSNKLMKLLGFTIFKKETKRFFSKLIGDTVARREKEGIVRPDMIHLVMQARKGMLKNEATDDMTDEITLDDKITKKLAAQLTDEDFTAQAILFYLAGFDTASTNLSFLFMLLSSHADVTRKVQEEVDQILEEEGGEMTYEGLARMTYLDMCISESLRMWPPAVMTNRRCVKAYTFPASDNSPAIRVNKGDGVWIPIYGMHRDPKYFADPDTFDPERFSDENKGSVDPYTYMPFGSGPRKCIGMRFALLETKVAVCSLLSRFDIKAKTTAKDLALSSYNMAYKNGFWIEFSERKTKSF